MPTYESIENHEKIDELEGQWEHMLAHQLQALPPMSSFWDDLEPFFNWLFGEAFEIENLPLASNEAPIQLPVWGTEVGAYTSNIAKIQFAAGNRVRMRMTYKKLSGEITERVIEPLSFRHSSAGNNLLYAFDINRQATRGFRLDHIIDLTITRERL